MTKAPRLLRFLLKLPLDQKLHMHAETCAKQQWRPRQPSEHLRPVFFVSLIQPLFGSDGRKRRFASILLCTAQFCSAQQ
jgi:hypothetical protein